MIQFGSLWFCRIPQDASWHKILSNVSAIPFSRPNFPNQPISSFICNSRHFVFLTTVCDVYVFSPNCIEKKLKCDAAPIIRTRRKCCRNAQKRQQEECRFMQIKAFIQLIFFPMKNYLYLNEKGRKTTILIIRALMT